ETGEGSVLLGFADGAGVRARRLVLTMPIPALKALAGASPVIHGPTWRRLYRSIEGFPATKLYCWYDRPRWRDGINAPTGTRTTTDLPYRMMFYFDEAPDRPAAILAAFTDHRRTEPIVALADGPSGGIDLAVQPDPALPIHLCGEVFSRHGAWVEGALGTASTVVDRILE